MTLDQDDLKVINDAKAVGSAALTDVQTFAHQLLLHIASGATHAIPDVVTAAQDKFYAFIPAPERGFIQGLVGSFGSGTITKLENETVTQANTLVGEALNRVDAAILAGQHEVGVDANGSVTLTAKKAA